jgi:hypothetical protein
MFAPAKAIGAISAGTPPPSRRLAAASGAVILNALDLRRVRLVVRTQPSQGWCKGSTPVRGAKLNYILASPEKALYGMVTGG